METNVMDMGLAIPNSLARQRSLLSAASVISLLRCSAKTSQGGGGKNQDVASVMGDGNQGDQSHWPAEQGKFTPGRWFLLMLN
jgi:hypothetical protein